MKRYAKLSVTSIEPKQPSGKRTAEDKLTLSPDQLLITLDALHWEQSRNATATERKLYKVDQAYAGNDNGDFFEGGRNVVWACRNASCTNRNDSRHDKGLKRFLKYAEKDSCPHCGSKDIYDWEHEAFQTKGELLARTHDGRYRYETWKGEPVNVNHNSKTRIGKIKDVWPEPPKKAIVELIALDRNGPHNNESICRKISAGLVDSGSMELLTGVGMCGLCFNVHHSDEDFCQHLEHNKGGIDQRTGMHVFEICKSIQGCGHAIIATGDPADDKALVRQVFAEKDEKGKPEVKESSNLHTMSQYDGKPTFEVKKSIDKSRLGQRAEGVADGVTEKPLPPMTDMKEQMAAFGNYDSTRTAQEIRLAKMSPQERAEYADFEAFRAAKASGRSSAVMPNKTLRVDKEILATVLRKAYRTKKISAAKLLDTITDLAANRTAFLADLGSRTQPTSALTRLARRKAQIEDEDSSKELVLDVIADALIEAGEKLKNSVTDVTYEDVGDAGEELTQDSESRDHFQEFLDEGDVDSEDGNSGEKEVPKSEEESIDEKDLNDPEKEEESEEEESEEEESEEHEPTVSHSHSQENAENADSLKHMKQEPTKIEAQKSDRNPKTEHFPDKTKDAAKGNIPSQSQNRSPKTEDFPEAKSVSLNDDGGSIKARMALLEKRKATLEARIASGDGSIQELAAQHAETESAIRTIQAQMRSPKSEKGIEAGSATNLGGGPSENPKAVPSMSGSRNPKPEKGIEATSMIDLGGDGVSENPKELPASERLALVTRFAAGATDLSGKDIATLKEMGVWPADKKSAQAKDATDGVPEIKDRRSPETEKFPEAKDAHDVEHDVKQRKLTMEDHPGNKHTAQVEDKGMVISDDTTIKEKGQASKTPDNQKEFDKRTGEPTKVGSHVAEYEDHTNDQHPTPVGEAAKNYDSDRVNQDPTKFKVSEENRMDERDGTPTKIGSTPYPDHGEIRNASLEGIFTPVAGAGKRSQSHWTIFANKQPIFRIALGEAFPQEVASQADTFASEPYAEALIGEIRTAGVENTHKKVFGGHGKVFTAAERKAQAIPQAPPAMADAAANPAGNAAPPANVAAPVADKIMNEAAPSVALTDLIANLIAPVVAESDTLSVASIMEELVNMAGDQVQVTELTTKMNQRVDDMKQGSGKPSAEAGASGTAPTANPNPNAGPDQTGAANQINPATMTPINATRKAGPNELVYARKLKALRVEPFVKEEQAVGLLDNYNTFRAAGKSRKEASSAAQEILETRFAELMDMDETTYLAVESAGKKAIAALKQSKLPGASRDAAKRKAAWDHLRATSGGVVIEALGGESHRAASYDPNKPKLSNMRWSSGGVDPDKHTKELEKRDMRDSKKD